MKIVVIAIAAWLERSRLAADLSLNSPHHAPFRDSFIAAGFHAEIGNVSRNLSPRRPLLRKYFFLGTASAPERDASKSTDDTRVKLYSHYDSRCAYEIS